jgi:adenylate kinase family enzyme
VRRVSVVGVSGSGKSTFGRELAARLAVPYAELDAIFHQPEWTPLPEEQFRRRVAAIAAGDGWVIDGNYSAVQPLVWERADTVVWLDPPRRTVMRRIIWRTIRRVASRAELWNGNRSRSSRGPGTATPSTGSVTLPRRATPGTPASGSTGSPPAPMRAGS